MTRIAIIGGPRVGKSTLALELGKKFNIVPSSSDMLIGQMEWSEASEEVARWLTDPKDYIVEGVAVVRSIRKYIRDNPDGCPCDQIIYLYKPYEVLSKGQMSMTKGHITIWNEVKSELFKRHLGHIISDGSSCQ